MNHKLLIVGGGAAGIMAAIVAKDLGVDVAVVEGNDRLGKKILTTGNGRCNITNSYIDEMMNHYKETAISEVGLEPWRMRFHSENPDFFIPTLKAFTVKDTISFFSSIGLPIFSLEEGKMYPRSLQASSVLDIFRMAVEDREIPIYSSHRVTSIKSEKKGFKVFYKSQEGEGHLQCDRLILCTGGKAAPSTGSDGSGYNFVKTLGHTIIQPVPALVQLKLDYRNLKALSGIKFDGYAEIFVNNAPCRREMGEILFTDYGISGPPILQLSRIASYNLSRKRKISLKVDMLPDMNIDDLSNFLEVHWSMFSHRGALDSFIGVINKKLIPILLKEAGLSDIHKPCWELEWKEKKSIISLLKGWEFTVIDTNSFSNAQVTAGGVNTAEVNPVTLESKLSPSLFFAGEILDVDGDCGGYNLQWAWSSAYVAAKAAVDSMK